VVVASRLVRILEEYPVLVSLARDMGFQHKGVLVVVLVRLVLGQQEVGPFP